MKRIFLIVLSLLVLSGSAWAAAFSGRCVVRGGRGMVR